MPPANEIKYQAIKLALSGRSLAEIKAFIKTATMALHEEYTAEKHLQDLMALEGGLAALRSKKKDALKAKFAPRKLLAGHARAEFLAKFVTGKRNPISWKRDGNLIRRGPKNKPRPGSSAGKVGKTRVIGLQKTLLQLRKLQAALQKLTNPSPKQKQLLAGFAKQLNIRASLV